MKGKIFKDEDGNEYEAYIKNGIGYFIKPKTPARWRADLDKYYWYVDSDELVEKAIDRRRDTANYRYSIGNYFRTKEQAEAAAEAVIALLEYVNDIGSWSERWHPNGQLEGLIDSARKALQEDK